MHLKRRNFFQHAAAIGASTFLSSGAVKALGASKTRLVKLTLAAQDEAVLAWLRRFTSQIRLVGSAVYARLEGDTQAPAQWIASVELTDLPSAIASANFSGPYASGSTLSFKIGTAEVSVDLLPPDAFQARLAELSRAGVRFDHDSLAYDPLTQSLNDPLRSKSTRGLRVTHTAGDPAEAFRQVLDGLIEIRRLGLLASDSFNRFSARVLRADGSKPAVAAAVSGILLGRLATWTSAAPVAQIERVLLSRLVSTSLQTALGIDAVAAVASARAALAVDRASSSSVWINALTGSDRGTPAGGLLLGGDRFDQLRSLAVTSLR